MHIVHIVKTEMKPVGVRFTVAQRDALQVIADKEYNSPSNLIRRAVDEFIKRYKADEEQPELFDAGAHLNVVEEDEPPVAVNFSKQPRREDGK